MANLSKQQRVNFDGSPHVCDFNADGQCRTHAFSQPVEVITSIEALTSKERSAQEAHEHYQPQLDEQIAENNRLRAAPERMLAAILSWIGRADELLVRRIWDDARRAALSADSSAHETGNYGEGR